MSFAVMQTGSAAPSPEQLRTTFQKVPGLTAADARLLGKDARGILANGLEREGASAMRLAFAAQGIETELVADAALPVLPPPRQLAKVDFTPEGLLTDDLIGQIVLLEWNDILLIAAGRARLTDFRREIVTKLMRIPMSRDAGPRVVIQGVTKEEQRDHLLLEIFTRKTALRYHVKADRPETRLLFGSLGESRNRNPAVNLSRFVRELVEYAPTAVLNRGALEMRDRGAPSFGYPSQTAFYREITWLLWMISTGRTRGWISA